jgi:ubiquinone/menaquinone biosynthesis C-methylase UbiE
VAERSGQRARFFDLWSRVYDAPVVQRVVYRPEQDAVLDALGPAARVLDIGCGTGLLTSRVARDRPLATVVGCDLSAGMLEQASARGSAAVWVRGDAVRVPFADMTFDAVLSTESFHWYPDQRLALAELHRVLRPGGRLLVSVLSPITRVASRVMGRTTRITGNDAHFPTRGEMRGLLAGSGFRVERQAAVRRFGVPSVVDAVLTVGVRDP